MPSAPEPMFCWPCRPGEWLQTSTAKCASLGACATSRCSSEHPDWDAPRCQLGFQVLRIGEDSGQVASIAVRSQKTLSPPQTIYPPIVLCCTSNQIQIPDCHLQESEVIWLPAQLSHIFSYRTPPHYPQELLVPFSHSFPPQGLCICHSLCQACSPSPPLAWMIHYHYSGLLFFNAESIRAGTMPAMVTTISSNVCVYSTQRGPAFNKYLLNE